MRVAKRYIAKEECTVYCVNTIEIIAESEEEAMELLRDRDKSRCKHINTDVQEERMDQRWIDSSEPLTDDELTELDE